MNDPSIIYESRLHRIIFFWPAALFLVAVYTYFNHSTLQTVALILTGVALFWIVMTWVTYYFSSITIKKDQVILKSGLLIRKTIDIRINKIESIDITQSLLGSLCHYGLLIIIGTGGTQNMINFICRPLTCRRHIEQLMNRQAN